MVLQSASVSLPGDREENQDRCTLLRHGERSLLVLGDGMGGHADGAQAAQCLIDAATDLLPGIDSTPPTELLQRIALEAHRRIVEINPDLPNEEQARTTAVFCLFNSGSALFAHAGDSRAYHFRQRELVSRTRDHSVVELLYRTGRISAEDVRSHPLRSQVSRCLGGLGEEPRLEFSPAGAVEDGDVFLVCSDGLWEPLDDLRLAVGLDDELQGGLDALADEAVRQHQGYADNCTAIAARFVRTG